MSQYLSINSFPDTWGVNARCPVCKSRTMKCNSLSILQLTSCIAKYCGVSFEVEEKGEHIFFTQTPIDLEMQLKPPLGDPTTISQRTAKTAAIQINTFQAPFIE